MSTSNAAADHRHGITALLTAWKEGDPATEEALAREIYPILRDIAHAQKHRHSGRLTLQATELVHEAYERLHRQRAVDWQNRAHFFAIAATVVRRVVIDHVRQREAEKRGGDLVFVGLDEIGAGSIAAPEAGIDWLALDEALHELAQADADYARVVELRLFSGLTLEQIAAIRNVSMSTVCRQWRFARVWLTERLEGTVSSAS